MRLVPHSLTAIGLEKSTLLSAKSVRGWRLYGCKLIKRTKTKRDGGKRGAIDNGNAHKVYLHASVRTEK